MTSIEICELHSALDALMKAQRRAQAAIDALFEPSASGYLHGRESWTIRGVVVEGEATMLSLDPPEHEYVWQYPTTERLDRIRDAFAADEVCAATVHDASGRDRPPRVFYRCRLLTPGEPE